MVAVAARKLDAVTFDELIAQQDPFGSPAAILDLRDFGFVTPAALVQLAALCYALEHRGRRPLIRIEDAAVRSYLQRAGFTTAVAGVASFDPPLAGHSRLTLLRGTNPLLVEVTRIECGTDLPRILDQIVDVLRRRLKYGKHDAFDVAVAISEISQNTFDHNSNTCGLLAMQVFGRGRKQFLEIGVADYGEGLATTLARNSKNGAIPSDIHAIRLATQLHTSEHDDPTRGTGLYHLLEIAFAHQGAVQIRSGSGKVRYRMDQRRGWEFPVMRVPGVQIALALQSKKKG